MNRPLHIEVSNLAKTWIRAAEEGWRLNWPRRQTQVAKNVNALELDVRLGEQPALEQLRVGRLILLLERDHDTQPAASDLAPVRAAEDHAASLSRCRCPRPDRTNPDRRCRPSRSRPCRRFAEERHAAALHVHGDERIVGRGQILRRGDDVRALVAAHARWPRCAGDLSRTSRTGRTPRCSPCPSSLSSANGRKVARPSMLLYLSISARP